MICTGIHWYILVPVELLYRGHHWDPAGCTVYSGTSLYIEDTIGTQLAVLYTEEPLYSGHHWDPAGCPVQRGVPNSEVVLYTALCGWDCRQCPH